MQTIKIMCLLLLAWPQATETKQTPFIVVYSPPWCHVCKVMERDVGAGNEKLTVYWVHDEDHFPQHVRDYGKQYEYPVMHHTSPKGAGVLNHGKRNLQQLIRLVTCEPNDPEPARKPVKIPSHTLVQRK